MLEQMIQNVIEKFIKAKYHHIRLPSSVFAKITKVQEQAEYYIYNLKILDENKAINPEFPEIPEVKSEIKLENGDIATVLLLYGQLNVYIIGKVI
ncbi:hypothetical protein KQI38_09260 [Tissierella carlieri]|uniref:hypothetical protein n=1 Tax=Tissierella carlieri TaxID=689904 RepID=UPI001C117A3C|nr:hypothetical protein [Tissierella carlieri]MBU5312214.1 hypothetical protein [Tissierella carlieri]